MKRVVGEDGAGYGRRIRSGRRAPGRLSDGDRGRGHARRRRVASRRRRAVASPAPAPAVRTGGGLHAGASPPELVRPPRLRRGRPGLPWSRRLGWDVHAVRRRGPDGAATIEWAATLPFSDGRVATYGFSYQGLAQLYAAARRPPSLRGVAAMMCCPEPVRRLDVRGRLPAAPVRRILERAARRAGAWARSGPLRRRVVAGRAAALGDDPPTVVHRVAGAPQRRCLLGGTPAGPLHDRCSGLHRPRLLRRLLVRHGPDHRHARCGGGVRTVDPHALGLPSRRRGAGRRGGSGDRLRTPRRLLRPGVRSRAATAS